MAGVYYTTEPDGYLEPVMTHGQYGCLPPITVNERFKSTVEKFGDRGAMYLKRPVNGVIPEDWKVWTWNDYYRDCSRFAKSLIHLGVRPFRIINILGFNSVSRLGGNIMSS